MRKKCIYIMHHNHIIWSLSKKNLNLSDIHSIEYDFRRKDCKKILNPFKVNTNFQNYCCVFHGSIRYYSCTSIRTGAHEKITYDRPQANFFTIPGVHTILSLLRLLTQCCIRSILNINVAAYALCMQY